MPRGMSAFVQQANTAQGFVTNRLETRNFFGDAPLLRASAAFRYTPLFCSFADVVRARITKAAIALPKYCPCGSSLRTSDTGNPNTRYLCLSRSPRTMGPHKPEPLDQKTHQQERRQ